MSILDNLYHYKFRVDRCIDGDTYEGKLDKGKKNYDEDVQIRLNSINCPEITKAKTPEEKERGLAAKTFAESLVLNQWLVVKTYKPKDDDSFGRMLADVYLPTPEGDLFINQHLVENGHAVPYRVRK